MCVYVPGIQVGSCPDHILLLVLQYRLLPPFKLLPGSHRYTASYALTSTLKLIVTDPQRGSLSSGHAGVSPVDIPGI